MKIFKFNLDDNAKFVVNDINGNLHENIPSYTIFSAIINNISILFGKERAGESIKHFEEEDNRISSMFLGLNFKNKKTENIVDIYFLPKPAANIEKTYEEEADLEKNIQLRKKVKGIKLISVKALEEIGKTWNEEKSRFEFDMFKLVFIGSSLACLKSEIENLDIDEEELKDLSFFYTDSNAHVLLDRLSISDENRLFTIDERVYQSRETKDYLISPFLYFMYKGSINEEIIGAINLIVDEGIGGKRSVGAGRFKDVEMNDLDYEDREAKVYINLSNFRPNIEETKELVAYELEKINGYIYSQGGVSYRKRTITLVKEGAILSEIVDGRISNVTPINVDLKHDVYNYGKAFLIGLGDLDG